MITIRNFGLLLVLAAAMLAMPVFAQGVAGNGGVDILGKGIFETEGSAFQFYEAQDTNVDNLAVGNDRAYSTGWAGVFPWDNNGPAIATNNLEVKKNQDSGECECCKAYDDGGQGARVADASLGCGGKGSDCRDCCIKVNLESLKIGDRDAMAFGLAVSTNNEKIVTNQQ